MPSPKRWHPVSRDLFEDPELWELATKYGDRAVFTWLLILAELDKRDNRWPLTGEWLASLSRRARHRLDKCRASIDWMVAAGWLRMETGSPSILTAPNYLKYHKRSEAKRDDTTSPNVSDAARTTVPSLPSEPSRSEPNQEKERKEFRGSGAHSQGLRKNGKASPSPGFQRLGRILPSEVKTSSSPHRTEPEAAAPSDLLGKNRPCQECGHKWRDHHGGRPGNPDAYGTGRCFHCEECPVFKELEVSV